MIGIDTNVLVRYVAGDDAAQRKQVQSFFDRQQRRAETIRINLVVLAETVWVLQSRFDVSAAEISALVDELLTDSRFELQDPTAVALACDDSEGGTGAFADRLIAAVNASHRCTTTYTFDRRAARRPGMTLLA